MIVIIKNNTQDPITVKDLSGVTVAVSDQVDLTDIFKFTDIASSVDLKSYVSSGDLTVNDGTEDLSTADGLKHIEIKSAYETIIDVQDNSHEIDDHTDVPDKPTSGRYLLDSTDGVITWANYNEISKRSLTFRADPTFNGEISLLGWYININDDPEVNESLSSGTTYNSFHEAFHSHIVLNIVSATGLPFTIRITGTSVNESTGALTASDTEDISITATGYCQSSKSWINKIDLDIVEASKSCSFDIYRTTYWDRGNVDFTIKGCRLEWTPDQNDWKLHIKLYHHQENGSLSLIDEILFEDEDSPIRASADQPGKYKRGDYSLTLQGASQSGLIVWVDQRAIGSFFLEVKYE